MSAMDGKRTLPHCPIETPFGGQRGVHCIYGVPLAGLACGPRLYDGCALILWKCPPELALMEAMTFAGFIWVASRLQPPVG